MIGALVKKEKVPVADEQEEGEREASPGRVIDCGELARRTGCGSSAVVPATDSQPALAT